MSQPSLWSLLRNDADLLSASTPLETVESSRKKLQALFWSLTTLAALATVALMVSPLWGPLKYGETSTALVFLVMALTTFFAICAHHAKAALKPLNAEIDSNCERALALVDSCKEAAAYRDEVLNAGRELVGFDLTRLEDLAETAKSKAMQEKAKLVFAAADAEQVACTHRKAMESNKKLAWTFCAVAVGFAALTFFVDESFLKSASLVMAFASFVATIYTIVVRADLLDLKMPVWLASNSLIERGLAVAVSRGPGAQALVKLKHEGRSATRGDILDAIRLDQAERIACKVLHKVSDAS